MTDSPSVFRQKILYWYDRHRRVLPWRALPGQNADPYHVWLSEIMLQQTTVQAVIPYFLKFIQKWPDVHALAAAENDDVMSAWAGLGYYARARNLHKCAKILSNDLGSVFPNTQKELIKLPGIGDYTSAAITSIAFDKPAVVIDGNVDRVMARYHAIETPFPEGKMDVRKFATQYVDDFADRASDYAQSLMDLGATICTPKSPSCLLCPFNETCQAYSLGRTSDFPIKAPKKAKPHKYGFVYWITNDKEEVLIHKRPEKGMLAGMNGLPTTEWLEKQEDVSHLGFTDLKAVDAKVTHVFTHFSLDLFLFKGRIKDASCLSSVYDFYPIEDLDTSSFPTLFKKAISLF